MKQAITLSILLVLFVALARADCPTVSSGLGRIVAITNLNDYLVGDRTCRKLTYSGLVSSVVYSDEGDTEPSSIILQMPDKTRQQIGLDDNLTNCLSSNERSAWKRQIRKGVRVRVVAYRCGASGNSDLQAFRVEFR